ncbi:MAG: DNA-3-methyladenine glycosylase 2 family protein [Verrucomicrobia bacterium]|nr:DNA-3-methyladenine glycosylase 2 family protein [Verrucomicrobiota bacterium]
MWSSAQAHLAAVCPVMRGLIERAGPCPIEPQRLRSPFEALVRAVAHQQLHGKAAETILGRFIALFPGRRFPKPEQLAAVDDTALRAAGFSAAKTAAIRDLAAKALDGTIPTARSIARLDDEEIIARLIQVRGVGRWTVEMMLIFKLGRPDVWPVDDFGVRNGYRLAYGLPALPRPKELLALGDRFRPWRSVATWYLYRAAEVREP